MSASAGYAKQIAALIARKMGANYTEMMQGTGLSYAQCAHGIHYLNRNGGINGLPLRRAADPMNPWGRRFWVAAQAVEVLPHVAYRARYMNTMAQVLDAIVNNTVDAFGSDPDWSRLQIDVGRVRQDVEMMLTRNGL